MHSRWHLGHQNPSWPWRGRICQSWLSRVLSYVSLLLITDTVYITLWPLAWIMWSYQKYSRHSNSFAAIVSLGKKKKRLSSEEAKPVWIYLDEAHTFQKGTETWCEVLALIHPKHKVIGDDNLITGQGKAGIPLLFREWILLPWPIQAVIKFLGTGWMGGFNSLSPTVLQAVPCLLCCSTSEVPRLGILCLEGGFYQDWKEYE